jgi:hypothetical protein
MHTPVLGISPDAQILTSYGWRPVMSLEPGTSLAHPEGVRNELIDVAVLDEASMATSFTIAEGQPFPVQLVGGEQAPRHIMDARLVHDAILRNRPVALPRSGPYAFGTGHMGLDGWLLGILLGDGYLRQHSVMLANEQEEVHELVRAALPNGAKLNPMRIGMAGTGSADIVGTKRNINPVLQILRDLELTGKRAWDKRIPRCYLEAPLETRLGVLRGLLDSDGHIDAYGRIEFSSSSQQLTLDLLELIHGFGGRARYKIKSGVTFTSPRQRTPKPARDAHMLLNIRLPEHIRPFARPSRLARWRPRHRARQWTITSVECAGVGKSIALAVSASDGLIICDGPVALITTPTPAGLRVAA